MARSTEGRSDGIPHVHGCRLQGCEVPNFPGILRYLTATAIVTDGQSAEGGIAADKRLPKKAHDPIQSPSTGLMSPTSGSGCLKASVPNSRQLPL